MNPESDLEPLVPVTKKQVEAAQAAFTQHPFLTDLGIRNLSLPFARRLTATQLGYNLAFVKALALLRIHFARFPSFIVEFVDPHLATEFGSDLPEHGLIQDGRTHVALVYDLAASLEMDAESLQAWGASADAFYQGAVGAMIGGPEHAVALGALYADEVLAAAWFPVLDSAFRRLRDRSMASLQLGFFTIHAEEVEYAHVEHAARLPRQCESMELDARRFEWGYVEFRRRLSQWFHDLHQQMLKDPMVG